MKGIYWIKNLATGEIYIGESTNIEARKEYHLEHLRRGNHPNIKLQFSWNDYKEHNFEFKVLATLDEEVFKNPVYQKCILLWFENVYIRKYNTRELGFNQENTFFKVLQGKKVIFSNKDKDICSSVWDRYDKGLIIEKDGVITKPVEEVSFGTKLFY